MAPRKEKSGSRKIAIEYCIEIGFSEKMVERSIDRYGTFALIPLCVCQADRNCIITTETRNRELYAKNLNFQIRFALCVVGEIFYDYHELLYIQRSAYFTDGNTDVRGREGNSGRARSGVKQGKLEGAWREAGVLNSRVKPPLWPIHEWNGTSGREWGRKQLWSVTFPNGSTCARLFLYARSTTWKLVITLRVKNTHASRNSCNKTAALRDYPLFY